jgi:hypothetical protein
MTAGNRIGRLFQPGTPPPDPPDSGTPVVVELRPRLARRHGATAASLGQDLDAESAGEPRTA